MDTGFTIEQDNYCVTSGPEGVKIWDITAKSLVKALSIPALASHKSSILSVLSDGRILTLGSAEVAKVSNVLAGATVSKSIDFDCANPIHHGVASSSKQNQIACVSEATLIIFNINEPSNPNVLVGHDDIISSLAFHPLKYQVCTSSFDCTIKLWNTDDMILTHTLAGHNKEINSVAWVGEDLIVSGSKDATAKVWSSKTAFSQSSCIKDFPHFSSVTAVAGSLPSSPSPLIATGTEKGIVRCFQMPSGSMRFAIKAFDEPISTVCFTDDARYIIATGSTKLLVLDVLNDGASDFETKVSAVDIYACISTKTIPVLLAHASTSGISGPEYFDLSLQGRYAAVDPSRIFSGTPHICPVCKNAIVDPHPSRTVQTPCCNTIWCKDCIIYRLSQEQNPVCLHCSKPCTEAQLSSVSDEWDETSLVINCQYPNCPWKSTLSSLITHESRCQFAPKRCEYHLSGCSFIGTRSSVFTHQEECVYRPTKCTYSEQGCPAIVPLHTLDDHLSIDCKYQPIVCPNKSLGCNCPKVPRKDSNSYMRKNCNKYGIPCDFEYLGCKWRGLDHSLHSHLVSDCPYHSLRDLLTDLYAKIDMWKVTANNLLEVNDIPTIHTTLREQLNEEPEEPEQEPLEKS